MLELIERCLETAIGAHNRINIGLKVVKCADGRTNKHEIVSDAENHAYPAGALHLAEDFVILLRKIEYPV